MGERATIDQDYLYGAADAIRRKNGTSNTYTPAQFEAAIDALPDAPVLVAKTITANGEYDPEDDNADGYSGVIVSVPSSQPNLQSKTVNQNGTVLPDAGYDGLSSVVVNVSGGGGSFATAVCHGPNNATVTATDGVTTLTGVISSGKVSFDIPNSGTWTFTCGDIIVEKSITAQGSTVTFSIYFEITQNNISSGNHWFEYTNEGKTMIVTLEYLVAHDGIVFDVRGYNHVQILGSSQCGECTKEATLPSITNAGTGRVSYQSRDAADFIRSGDDRFFAVLYNKTVNRLYVIQMNILN